MSKSYFCSFFLKKTNNFFILNKHVYRPNLALKYRCLRCQIELLVRLVIYQPQANTLVEAIFFLKVRLEEPLNDFETPQIFLPERVTETAVNNCFNRHLLLAN